MVSIKKTEKTKAKLLKAVHLIISKGDKASVSSITKKAKLAYGTFYRYFKDLDEIYLEAIEASLTDLSVKLTQDLANVNPAPLRVYVTWYLVIDAFKDKHTAAWLLDHPGIINKAFFDAAPMTEVWIQEAIKDSKLPSFTKKNADHYFVIAKLMDGIDQRWIGLRHVFPHMRLRTRWAAGAIPSEARESGTHPQYEPLRPLVRRCWPRP